MYADTKKDPSNPFIIKTIRGALVCCVYNDNFKESLLSHFVLHILLLHVFRHSVI